MIALSSVLADLGRILASRPLSRGEVEAVSIDLDRVEPADLAEAVHILVSEGIGYEALKPAVSRLINLVSRPLSRVIFAPDDPFFESLLLENQAFLRELDALRPFAAAAASAAPGLLEELRSRLERLGAIDLHYVKKENILFPYFEARFPRYRCVSLMWSLHDDVRASLSRLEAVLRRGAPAGGEIAALLGKLFFDAHALVFREEKALFPIVYCLLDREERSALFVESKALGFCFLDPATVAALDASARGRAGPRAAKGAGGIAPGDGLGIGPKLDLDSGALEPRLVDLILKALPIDLTFVDAEDRVAYFSNGDGRAFPRSPAIIGRDVRNCHPSKSVDRVLAILESFKSGARDREEFWLETGGCFVRIEYRALRDEGGKYLGTLEISQDLTAARALEGEKRLASP